MGAGDELEAVPVAVSIIDYRRVPTARRVIKVPVNIQIRRFRSRSPGGPGRPGEGGLASWRNRNG
ncbi:hypothetical protein SAMN04489716_7612 [Actinoplanes derwentensis]|uniref:Uncharacterized protein n=1 Tax=Actinoplanes derwentensis TaxID=113562 RepID=A0A1H2D1S4_9ACTN|nr:hypothetical protein SAMN04489716_7612 [Actinoplanes derwentensis]